MLQYAIELFDTTATLHEIETYLWLLNNRLDFLAESLRQRLLERSKVEHGRRRSKENL